MIERNEDVTKQVKIAQVRLVNCQSWEDTTIELSPGINVLIASNSTGKSVFFKILKEVVSPGHLEREERVDLIREGAEYAEAYYLFDDNSLAVIRIFPQRILYYYTPNAESGEFTQMENRPHEAILRKLSAIVEPETGFVANILDDPANLLLVNSNPKATSSLIKILAKDQRMDRLIETFKAKVQEYENTQNEVTIIKNSLERKLNKLEYIDIDTLENNINFAEIMLDCTDTIVRLEKNASRLIPLVQEYKPYTEFRLVATLLAELEDICDDIVPVKSLPQEQKELLGLVEYLDTFVNEYKPSINIELNKAISNVIGIYENAIQIEAKPEIDYKKVMDEINVVEILDKILNTSYKLYNQVQDTIKVNKELEELKSIDFGGQQFDCPIHGKIVYTGEGCQPI